MALPRFQDDINNFDQDVALPSLPSFQDDMSNFEQLPDFAGSLSMSIQQAQRKQQEEAQINDQVEPIDQIDLELPEEAEQSAVLERGGEITQTFGQKSKYDVFSGGINYGTDIAVNAGTKVAAPAGQWEVVDVFDGADNNGFIGNKTNSGYGNSVLLRNAKTGELIRMSHLSPGIRLQKGQTLNGGQVFARTGSSGNVTGAHLDIEYYNQDGKIADVQKSPYWGSMFSASGGGDPKSFFEKLTGGIKSFVQENITGTKESRKKSRKERSEAMRSAMKGDDRELREQTREEAESIALGATAQPGIRPILNTKTAKQVLKAGDIISKPSTMTDPIARETIEDAFSKSLKDIPANMLKKKPQDLTIFDKLEIMKKIIGQQADEIATKRGVVTGSTRRSESLEKALKETLPSVTRFQK